ncbi:MAG: hypothetical protein H0X26_06715 [Alphaproteobacteria bacterium]|nr:hypothetical protein [Alphaproteobacteria bacterium]
MNITKKFFYSLVLLSTALTAPATARIHPTAFKGISNCFLKDAELYSPTLGDTALETGLVEGLRFKGPYEANTEGEYFKDKSNEPLWNVVKRLFPSNNGQLGTTTGAADNFARYVKNPQTASLLVNYIKRVEDERGKRTLSSDVTTAFLDKIYDTLVGVDNEDDENKIKNFKDQTIKPLLKCIRQSVEAEKNGTSLYPRGTTVQIIQSFFCYHFNTRDDILEMLKYLDDSIVDKSKPLPNADDYLTLEDVPLIAKKPSLNVDDLFALTQEYLFTSLTPFKPNISLLNNSSTHFYDRANNQEIVEKTFQDCVETSIRLTLTLALFNPLTRQFDLAPVKSFVTKREKVTGLKNPYFENFETFFSQLDLYSANAGDIVTRSLWNRAVAGLPNTKYCTLEGNEINPGFINLLTTVNTIFDLDLPPLLAAERKAREQWVVDSFMKLFSTLNPTYAYTISLNDSKLYKQEVIGDLLVTVKYLKTKYDLFSFNLYSNLYDLDNRERGHGEVNELKIFKSQGATYQREINKNLPSLESGTTKESLMLLAPSYRNNKIHPLYKIYRQPLADNYSRACSLQHLMDYSWEVKSSQKPWVKMMAKNIIEDIAWHELSTDLTIPLFSLMMGSDIFSDLLGQKKFQEGIRDRNCLTFYPNRFEIETLRGLKELPKLDSIYSSYCSFTKVIFDNPLPSLTSISFGDVSCLEEFSGLENLPSLVSLHLEKTRVKKLEFKKPLLNFKNLYLYNSDITEIIGLENLPILRCLALSETKNLSFLEFSTCHEIFEEFWLNNSNIQKIVGLDNLPNLQKLWLKGTKNLTSLDISKKLDKLTELLLDESGIITISGLENIPNVHKLHLEKTTKLEKIELNTPFKKLKDFSLTHSGIKEISGLENLVMVQELYLDHTKNLKKVAFQAPLPALTLLHLNHSGVTEVTGLEGFKCLRRIGLKKTLIETLDTGKLRLSDLNLEGTEKLTRLKFDGEQKYLKLHLKGSGLKKLEDIEGYEHVRKDFISF